MTDTPEYTPPEVWVWEKDDSPKWRYGNINRPIAGATHDKELARGKHPLQLYSLGTPNGVKVTIMLEELLAAGHRSGDEIGHDRRAAAIMDVLNRRIRGERNLGAEQMAWGTGTGRAKQQAARFCLSPGEQLGHGVCRAVHGHDEESRKPKRQADRSKAVHGIVRSRPHGRDRAKLRTDR